MRLLALSSLLLIGCSSPTPTSPSGKAPPAPAVQATAPAPAAAPAPRAAVEPTLTDQDFSSGRDPFQRRAEPVKPPPVKPEQQGKIALRAFGLDELKLVGVVRGPVDRALFVAPSGEGATVKRGDLLGKDGSRVQWILPAGVVVRVAEAAEDRTYEGDRLIRLTPRRLGPS